MRNLPSVSVIIPCRNAGGWLRQAIASALAAAGVREVIVADDGSTDDSVAIARSFGPPVKVLALPPRGGNTARNQGAAAATGAWLQFLDADDYLEPQKITRQFEEAGDWSQADVLYSPVWIETWRDGARVDRHAAALDPTSDRFTQWITWQLPQTGGALWRAEALQRIGGWNEAMPCCQEHELYLRALQADLRWVYCPSPGAVYRLWSEQTVCRKDPVLVIREKTRLVDQALAWLRARGALRDAHLRAAGQAGFEMARTWAKYDLGGAAAYYADRAARGLMRPAGPAAPLRFRVALRLLGFKRAEQMAQAARSSPA